MANLMSMMSAMGAHGNRMHISTVGNGMQMVINGNHVSMGHGGYDYGEVDSENGNDDEIDSNEAAGGE